MLLVFGMVELVAEFAEQVGGRVAEHLRGALVREREPPVHRVPRHELHAAAAQAAFRRVRSRRHLTINTNVVTKWSNIPYLHDFRRRIIQALGDNLVGAKSERSAYFIKTTGLSRTFTIGPINFLVSRWNGNITYDTDWNY